MLDTAERLFYARGVRSVGMDELVAETGLGKQSVYRLFPSKDALVEAYRARLRGSILALADRDLADPDPRAALLRVIDAIEESVRATTFRGCPFHNASIEYADPAHPVRQVAAGYREDLRARLRARAVQLVGDEAEGELLGDRLALLVDGAYVSAAHLGPDGPAATGLALARELVQGPPRRRPDTARSE